jgi:hypothetical protein
LLVYQQLETSDLLAKAPWHGGEVVVERRILGLEVVFVLANSMILRSL